MSAVCRSWRAAAGGVSIRLDITLDLAVAYDAHHMALVALEQAGGSPCRSASEATVAAATPPVVKARRRLAAWLAQNRQRLGSLCIQEASTTSEGTWTSGLWPAWVQDLVNIRDALTGQPQAPLGSIVLPAHLVKLELPVLGTTGTATFMKALRGCPSLQQLKLVPCYMHMSLLYAQGEQVTSNLVAEALAPLKQLTKLRLQWPYPVEEPGVCLAGLLRSLPPSLEDLWLRGFGRPNPRVKVSLPLSCFTHLVNLRQWHIAAVVEVEDDSSSSSSGGISSSGSGSGGIHPCVASWTGITELLPGCHKLRSVEARLQLPNLSFTRLSTAEPAAWQQLRGAQHLEEVSTCSPDFDETVAGLGQLSQLRRLVLRTCYPGAEPAVGDALRASIGGLHRLSELNVEDWMVMAAGPAMLTPLTQLAKLTVHCSPPHKRNIQGARAWLASPAVFVVKLVAAAVEDGWAPLQVLVLKGVPEAFLKEVREQVAAAAGTGLPSVEVVYELHDCWSEWPPAVFQHACRCHRSASQAVVLVAVATSLTLTDTSSSQDMHLQVAPR